MFGLKYNPANKPKISIPKKDRPLLIVLGLWYFMLGPFQTFAMVAASDVEFMDALHNGMIRWNKEGTELVHYSIWPHMIDNTLGSAGLWILTYMIFRFWRAGHFHQGLETIGNGMMAAFYAFTYVYTRIKFNVKKHKDTG